MGDSHVVHRCIRRVRQEYFEIASARPPSLTLRGRRPLRSGSAAEHSIDAQSRDRTSTSRVSTGRSTFELSGQEALHGRARRRARLESRDQRDSVVNHAPRTERSLERDCTSRHTSPSTRIASICVREARSGVLRARQWSEVESNRRALSGSGVTDRVLRQQRSLRCGEQNESRSLDVRDGLPPSRPDPGRRETSERRESRGEPEWRQPESDSDLDR